MPSFFAGVIGHRRGTPAEDIFDRHQSQQSEERHTGIIPEAGTHDVQGVGNIDRGVPGFKHFRRAGKWGCRMHE
jgi:hypothetical protein